MKKHEFIGHGVEKGTLNEVFGESLDSLQVTSGSLLPPFKTVRVSNEPFLEDFGVK